MRGMRAYHPAVVVLEGRSPGEQLCEMFPREVFGNLGRYMTLRRLRDAGLVTLKSYRVGTASWLAAEGALLLGSLESGAGRPKAVLGYLPPEKPQVLAMLLGTLRGSVLITQAWSASPRSGHALSRVSGGPALRRSGAMRAASGLRTRVRSGRSL